MWNQLDTEKNGEVSRKSTVTSRNKLAPFQRSGANGSWLAIRDAAIVSLIRTGTGLYYT